ncbi:MAG TPA: FimV/HubP family polar landmark protein, partial [Steroidobacteraceae bacterium]
MFAKRSSRALALLLALPSAALALGLGDIHLNSSLNSPLDAEIEVTDVAPDEVATVRAQLAAREVFSQNGIDYPAYLTNVQLRTVETTDGRHVIRIKSTDAITDPFITLLINVTWSHGQLVREYTMLLDPPVYTPNQSVASAPVSAPATGAETRAGGIARSAETPAPAPAAAPAMPAAEPAQAAPAETAAPAPSAPARRTTPQSTPAPSAPAPSAPAPSAAAAEQAANHLVERGETLSKIASGLTSASANSARTRSWILAIYQANPRAFDQNMNVMRAGAVLRIPEAAAAQAIAPAEATAEIERQFAAWRSNAAAPAAGAGAAQGSQPGRLHLVTPSESASAGTGTASSTAEVNALKGQVHDLEGQLAESKRLLDLKNQDLARLQSELAAKQRAAPAPAPAPPPAAPVAEQPPVAQAAPPPAPPAETPAPKEEQPPPVAEAAPPPITKPLARPTPATEPAPAPAEGGSFLDTIMGYWWVLALVALVLALVAGMRFLRARRASEFDDSLGRLAVAAASGAGGALGSGGSARGGGGFEAPTMRAMPLTEPEPDVVVEESGTHERPRFAAATGAPPAAARHVTADDTISSETAINLDQGDPLAEADFHMAYGLYDQAADLIRIAIGREPERRDLKLKLLEVFFVWGNKEQFLQAAHELAQTRAEAAPGEWEKILIMGKQLAPEDPLFSGGAGVGGAAAGGVDLNLEGGQSRVDFDLLGEGLPTDGQGVDLDIGSAVGDHTTELHEATTGVTDTNLAAIGATGVTRQMTAKMRQPNPDAEGPTVEQPMLEAREDRTVRAKIEPRLHGGEQTAELAIDDLGLDLGAVDTAEQPSLGAGADAPTMVAGFDERTRKRLEDTASEAGHLKSTTGQWQFDQDELESALTQAGLPADGSQTSRLAQLRGDTV